MSKKSNGNNFSFFISQLLGVVFITLKLLGISEVSEWSWWWVTAPFWIAAVVVIVVWILVIMIACVVSIWFH